MQTSDHAFACIPQINRQARFAGSLSWTDYGNVGLIEAAEMRIRESAKDTARVEVRDSSEPDEILTFHMRRVVKIVCDNPHKAMLGRTTGHGGNY